MITKCRWRIKCQLVFDLACRLVPFEIVQRYALAVLVAGLWKRVDHGGR